MGVALRTREFPLLRRERPRVESDELRLGVRDIGYNIPVEHEPPADELGRGCRLRSHRDGGSRRVRPCSSPTQRRASNPAIPSSLFRDASEP